MSSLINELAANLEREGQRTLEFWRGILPEQWGFEVYPDGPAWKVHNLLAHFTEVEGSISSLIAKITQGHPGVAEDFDIDRWNAQHTAELSIHDPEYLIEQFATRRAATVEMVKSMKPEDLEKRGRHPALGLTEVKHMLKLMYIHLQGHQRDIKRALKRAS
jgi:hypothetical protein